MPNQTPSRQQQRRPVVRSIALVLLALLILVCLVVLVAWLSVQPRKLRYSIEEGSINGYNLTKDDHFNASFHLVLRATNPNHKISLYYDRIDVTLFFDDQKLSVNNVGPFYQRRRSVSHLDLDLAANGVAIYGAVAEDMRLERAKGYLDLDVEIRAKIRVKVGVFKVHRKLKVLCGSVTVPFWSSKGFERVLCDVDMD